MKPLLIVLLLLFSVFGFSQKKKLQTKLISENISIDGKLDEPAWKDAPIATNFIMFDPDNGKPIPENKRTEVKVLYDNDAIYIGAVMYDNEPKKILKEIAKRDDFGTSDVFGVFINGFNDGQQDFRFLVTASDGQGDCLATDANGEDYSWDAVWKSKAVITDYGWVVEMKIPYAALRFSSEKKQTWGVNFFREIKRDRQKYSWNPIDNKIGTITQQTGILEGIENIKTPTRLFLLPYSSFYLTSNAAQKTTGTLKGGLDIKYGINDAFTLDAILVPDFGQTKYDDKILNLSPFEQQFSENRPFFTEGTDLFNKGNIFYSRRIGGVPDYSPTIASNEEIIDNPASINLLNALKISGRTKHGLGIGVLNAVTDKTWVTIKNDSTQVTRKAIISPLTNYNVLVFDQRFHKNSSASFINTNVWRAGDFRDANVSALVWDLNTKKNTYNLSGNIKYSYVKDVDTKKGSYSTLNFAETSGKYRYGVGGDLVTKDFDDNDLGINFQTNYYDFYGNASYRILNPTKHFNSFNTNINLYTQFEKETGKIEGNTLNFGVNINNKKNHYLGFGLNINPTKIYDFYEPRVEGRYVAVPSKFGGWVYISTNYNYKFALDFNPSYTVLNENKRVSYGFLINPRYRFNDKFTLVYSFNFFRQNNNKGHVDEIDDDNNPITPNIIIFANRNVVTYANTLSGKYSLNSKMNFDISIRHYWSYAENKNFLALQQDGTLVDYPSYNLNQNSNFNSWNLDLSYLWWFAPGSQVSVLYRNNAANFDDEINKDFGKNVSGLLNNNALNHVFSISIKYFIDYNQAKHWL